VANLIRKISKAYRNFWRRNQVLVIWALALMAVGLGYAGFQQYLPTGVSRLELFYRSLQLFVLQAQPFDQPPPLALEISRFLAPAVTIYTALMALHSIFSVRLRLLLLRLRPADAVICGLGRKGLQLARDFAADGSRIVVIDSDEHNDRLDLCRDLGALVLVGDAAEPDLLRNVLAQRARHVLATCGDDGVNVEIAVRVHQLYQELRTSRRRAMECFVHIVDPVLCDAFKENPIFHNVHDPFAVRVFNIFENSARLLLDAHLLDREHIGPQDERKVHLLIVGFGNMGQSIALQAARIGHFANGLNLRLSVVDRQAELKRRGFAGRYPQFEKICDTEFFSLGCDDAECLHLLDAWTADPAMLMSVAVCLDDDSNSLTCALQLANRLQSNPVPLCVRMEEDLGLAALLNSEQHCPELLQHIRAFGQIDLASAKSKLTNPEQDKLARITHDEFRKRGAAEGRSASDPSMREWDQLSEQLKDSNRQFADHIAVKLRAVRCVLDRPRAGEEPVTVFSKEERDVLAKMEHARWNAERFLAGWQFGQADKRRKISPHLVAWNALADEVKQHDYQLVDLIPHLVSRMNQQIYRVRGSPR